MKLTAMKPILVAGKVVVEGTSFEVPEQRGRELIMKGYAQTEDNEAQPGGDGVTKEEDEENEVQPVQAPQEEPKPKKGRETKI